jgi:hypothetical protein
MTSTITHHVDSVFHRFGTACYRLFTRLVPVHKNHLVQAAATNWACCDLYYVPPTHQCGTPLTCSYCCPAPKHFYAWYCHWSNRIIGCGECTTGSDCEHPNWYCSFGFDDGACGIPQNTC